MRIVDVSVVAAKIEELCLTTNHLLPLDIEKKLIECHKIEKTKVCKNALDAILKNIDTAKLLDIPICQDTGMAVVFLDIGQDVHLTGGNLYDAVNEGVRSAYVNGRMRCSIVADPLKRMNTNDNTPACIHTRIVNGDRITITVAPKGFGSENMSKLKMFTPSATKKDIIDFVRHTVDIAGSKPCPPIIVGVGLGGNFERCAELAKRALLRPLDIRNSDPYYAELENIMLTEINKTGIGAQGFGGSQTALAVNIIQAPTHIAGLPAAVNIGCHVTRHKTDII